MTQLLKDHVGLFKVGLALFVREGPAVLRRVQEIVGDRIFLDLKLHDIPETIRKASAVFKTMSGGVRFVTIHTSSGEAIVKAAIEAMEGKAQILGVTVLTSLSDEDLKTLGHQETIEERVLALSRIAKNAGCAGVVCAGREAKAVKQKLGAGFIVVTPGIRPGGMTIPGDDQRRPMTPREAVLQGADYIVVGRPIITAHNPVEAVEKISQEINSIIP